MRSKKLSFYDRTIERCSCNKILAFYFFHEIDFFFQLESFRFRTEIDKSTAAGVSAPQLEKQLNLIAVKILKVL